MLHERKKEVSVNDGMNDLAILQASAKVSPASRPQFLLASMAGVI